MRPRAGTDRARTLRRDRTEVEARLWRALRNRQLDGFKFRRQFPIDRYFADFACIEARLVVELDGGQHGERIEYDAERTRVLEALGFHVCRFWNHEVVENLDGVLKTIHAHLQPSPSPSPSHAPDGARAPPSPPAGARGR
jgi:very-short-patch-repair endonuclease